MQILSSPVATRRAGLGKFGVETAKFGIGHHETISKATDLQFSACDSMLAIELEIKKVARDANVISTNFQIRGQGEFLIGIL